MSPELRKYSYIGDADGVLFFAKHILAEDRTLLSVLKTDCSLQQDCQINYSCAIAAFEFLNIITTNNRYAYSTGIINNFQNEQDLKFQLSCICYKKLIDSSLLNIEKILFDESSQLFRIPRQGFLLDSAVFRNMLISLDSMFFRNDSYIIPKEYALVFSNGVKAKRREITIEELKEKLLREEEIGEAGEQFVISLEKNRHLTEGQKLSIAQVSKIAVSAGYDIASYIDESSTTFDKFIEVKTYIGKPHFFWTSNEIDIAKLRRENYYLYLVDFESINTPEYEPIVINNPYENVYENDEWKREIQTLKFEMQY